MITREELKPYARLRGLNLGQAEKDYSQSIILFIIYQNYGKNVVFKGGTALKKCYGLDRFSEDLDFTCLNKITLEKLESGLKRFRIDFEKETKKYDGGLKLTLRIKGPLYIGIRYSLCKFVVDFSFREKVLLEPRIKTIGRFLEEIPAFDVYVMQEKEILAEKVSAVLTRAKARDIYDLWFLLGKGVGFDLDLIKKKLEYYDHKWDFTEFQERINLIKAVWESELKPLLLRVPDFSEVKTDIIEKISKNG